MVNGPPTLKKPATADAMRRSQWIARVGHKCRLRLWECVYSPPALRICSSMVEQLRSRSHLRQGYDAAVFQGILPRRSALVEGGLKRPWVARVPALGAGGCGFESRQMHSFLRSVPRAYHS